MDGQAVEGRGAKRPRLSRTVKAFAAGAVCLMVGLLWWQKRADDFGGVVLAVEDALGMNKEPEPASGTVTVNGRPLVRGEISFRSPPKPGERYALGGRTHVRDGLYAFRRGSGPTPEVYEVTVTRWSPALERLRREEAQGLRTVPDDWKSHSVTTKAVLKADGKVDFDLTVPGW